MANYITSLGDTIENDFQDAFTGSSNTTLTNLQDVSVPIVKVLYSIGTKLANCNYQQAGVDISTILQPLAGEHLYTSPTKTERTYTFTVPAGVTSICILCVAGAAGPWNRCTQGNSSWFGGSTISPIVTAPGTAICYAGGGSGSGGGAGNGTEWFGNNTSTNIPITQTGAVFRSGGAATGTPGGGGGAAGYSGIGGTGAASGTAAPAGGGGGGGSTGRSGGGVGVYGQGTSGAANGGGGSGGSSTVGSGTASVGGSYGGGFGGASSYSGGGGALSYRNNYAVLPGANYVIHIGNGGGINTGGASGIGGPGAVRIIWGNGRAFPSTGVGLYNQALN